MEARRPVEKTLIHATARHPGVSAEKGSESGPRTGDGEEHGGDEERDARGLSLRAGPVSRSKREAESAGLTQRRGVLISVYWLYLSARIP